MKKILLFVITVVFLFTITGCKKEVKKETIKEPTKNNTIKVGTEDVDLSGTSTFNKMNYKYPSKATVNSVGTYSVVTYPKEKGADPLFEIGLTSFDGKSVEEVMSGSTATPSGTKIVNEREWNYYDDTVSGINTITYAYNYNGETYTITFISSENMKTISELFMKYVEFN